MTALGGLGHALPYLIPHFYVATSVAFAVVAVELVVISWIRTRYMDTPFLQAAFQVVVGGVLVFAVGILIGSADRKFVICYAASAMLSADLTALTPMFMLAHLSDLHMAVAAARARSLSSKRGLGFINWQRKRKHIHRPEVLDAIVRDLKTQQLDHIAVTGDLVNLSLPDEYARAREWLERRRAVRATSRSMPGNHDVYVRGVEAIACAILGRLHARRRRPRPFSVSAPARRRGADRAVDRRADRRRSWRPAGSAAGSLSRLAEVLGQTRDAFRVVLIHHPPLSPPRRYLRRLVDAPALRGVLAEQGAELLLHGHDHRRALIWLDGPEGTKIPAVGVPSASAARRTATKTPPAYHLFKHRRRSRQLALRNDRAAARRGRHDPRSRAQMFSS